MWIYSSICAAKTLVVLSKPQDSERLNTFNEYRSNAENNHRMRYFFRHQVVPRNLLGNENDDRDHTRMIRIKQKTRCNGKNTWFDVKLLEIYINVT